MSVYFKIDDTEEVGRSIEILDKGNVCCLYIFDNDRPVEMVNVPKEDLKKVVNDLL